jgi:hypothetical protein
MAIKSVAGRCPCALHGLALLRWGSHGGAQAGDVNFDRETARDRINGNNHPGFVLAAQQRALHSSQHTVSNHDLLAFDERRMRRRMAKLHTPSYAIYLICRHDGWGVSASDQRDHAGHAQNFRTLRERQMHENVSLKERHLQDHAPVLPLAHGTVTRKKMLDRMVSQPLCRLLFLIGANRQDKPVRIPGIEWQAVRQEGVLFSGGR